MRRERDPNKRHIVDVIVTDRRGLNKFAKRAGKMPDKPDLEVRQQVTNSDSGGNPMPDQRELSPNAANHIYGGPVIVKQANGEKVHVISFAGTARELYGGNISQRVARTRGKIRGAMPYKRPLKKPQISPRKPG